MTEIILDFELVPEPTWFFNLRYFLIPSEWELIKKKIKEKTNNECEICKRKVTKIHSHETWEYDDSLNIQKLSKIRGLCEDCHRVKHIGFANVNGETKLARDWYCKINKVSLKEELINENKAFAKWEERSKKDWQINLNDDILEKLIGRPPIFIGINYNGKYYLNVKYKEKDIVKKLGANWDNEIKAWYYTTPLDRPKFNKWLTILE